MPGAWSIEGSSSWYVVRSTNMLYNISLTLMQPVSLLANTNEVWSWKEHFDGLKKMGKGAMVHGLPLLGNVDHLCDPYLVVKQWRMSFPQEAMYHGSCAWWSVQPSHSRNTWRVMLLLLIINVCWYMCLMLLTTKDEATSTIHKFKVSVEVETCKKFHALHTNVATSSPRLPTVKNMPNMHGNIHSTTKWHCGVPESNCDGDCSLSSQGGEHGQHIFGGRWWALLSFYSTNCRQRALLARPSLRHGRMWKEVILHFMRMFGCITYVNITRPHVVMLNDWSKNMVFVGY